MSAKAV